MSGMEPLIIASLVSTAAGTATAAYGQKVSSDAAGKIAENDARALEVNAGQQRAAAQRRAEEEVRKSHIVMGEQIARLAASGGGVEGSGLDIVGRTAQRGLLNSEMRLWEGEEAARGGETQATMKRYAAAEGRSALPLQMGSTILKGAGDMLATGAKAQSSPSYYYGSDTTDPRSWRTSTVRYS